jgi:ABC-2 type transport system permease protein
MVTGAEMTARRADIRVGFWLVFWREIGWLRRRPFLLCLTTVVPFALLALMTAIFSEGLATRLPIGVLDLDGSDLSRSIIRTVDATPDTSVAVRVGDLAEGRQLILSGKIRGLLMLPLNLERDVQSARSPEVVFFYNTQTLTIGNLTLRGVSSAVPSVASGIRISLRTAQGMPSEAARADLAPIPVQTHALFNPALNYVHFLLAALLPSVLQVVIVTTMAYSVGVDFETEHRFRTLRLLGGGVWPAMMGKVLAYAFLYLAVLGIADSILFGVLGLPLRGDSGLLLLSSILFIVACQFLGALLALVVKPVGSAVSIGTLLTAPAFGYMGIGFPRLGMGDFAYGWGSMLPGTWYLSARIDQTVRGTPLDLSWKPVLVLAAFVVVLSAATAFRLEAIRASNERRRAIAAPAEIMG